MDATGAKADSGWNGTVDMLYQGFFNTAKHESSRIFQKTQSDIFLAQKTQRQHKGHKGETLTRLYIQNKIKSRRIALSKSRLCVLCAA
ncbi:MAG TPA: hypothetical protein PLC89_22970, partial [Haliscomenobacter sp.]|uniref:hypothetical protein n=1 Tax=Haliscomenobacter sp. TaxID=2717303 RepID=UPI002CC895D8